MIEYISREIMKNLILAEPFTPEEQEHFGAVVKAVVTATIGHLQHMGRLK